MNSQAQYYQAVVDEEAGQYGVAIARLAVAEASAKEANKVAANFPSFGRMPT